MRRGTPARSVNRPALREPRAVTASHSARFRCRLLFSAASENLGDRDSGQHEQAVEFAKQGIRQHPRSDWLWRELGRELTQIDCLDEADKALRNAHSLNPKDDWLWRYLAGLQRKRKNLEKEIEALETLYRLGAANGYDLNQLGIACHNDRDFRKALKYYRLSAAAEPDAAPWFNMGLVFDDSEVSQDVDATDAYRYRPRVKWGQYQDGRRLLHARPCELAGRSVFFAFRRPLPGSAQVKRPDHG